MEKKDLAIIGAGIAGIASGIYARRAGLTFELFEKKTVGGQLGFVGALDNYIGIVPGATGFELVSSLNETLKKMDIPPRHEDVKKIAPGTGKITVHTEAGEYIFGAVIIASGATWRTLGVAGEAEFLGKGVSYCAVCDGFFFKNKDVCVIGGGNTAVEEALYLSRLCNKVYLIHRRDRLRALDYLQKELTETKNIEVCLESELTQIKGDAFVEEVTARKKDGTVFRFSVNGVFIAIGMEPATGFFRDVVACDEHGFIISDEEMSTSQKGIFSCGDCRRRPLRQLITAAGEGAVAAMSAYRYLKGNYISS
ncbi:MAG: FAD-dependent oxidoreductase [Candidatus Omnitrophica bacterium]|nr:FAD-dependent oxidoreductase [Candidatus Omnitrophota bacterium]